MQLVGAISVAVVLMAAVCCEVSATKAPKYCRVPGFPENGIHSGKGLKYFLPGRVLHFSCNTGYRLEGATSTTCYYNRQSRSYKWTIAMPRCLPVSRDQSNDKKGGNNERPRGNKGRGRSDSTSEGGRDVQCPLLPSVPFGSVTYGNDNRRPGCIATYMCRHGYSLSGSPFRKCLNSGDWSGSPPTCGESDQDDDDRDDDESDSSESSYVKSVSRDQSSDKERGNNNRWRGNKGRGRNDSTSEGGHDVQCPLLPSVSFGSVTYGNDNRRPGCIATYMCRRGYSLSGSPSRKCLNSGDWSGSSPTCGESDQDNEDRDDDESDSDSSSSKSVSRDQSSNKKRGNNNRWKGNKGRGRNDSTSEGGRDVQCPLLPSVPFGSVTYGNDNRRPGCIATYMCRRGYSLSGSPFRKCLNSGDWSGSPPTCGESDQDNKDRDDDESDSDSSSSKSVSRDQSSDKKQGNNNRWRGNKGRSRSDSTSKGGRDVQCPLLPSVPFGSVTYGNDNRRPGCIATYMCRRSYSLSGSPYRKCLNSGDWSGSSPTCRESDQDDDDRDDKSDSSVSSSSKSVSRDQSNDKKRGNNDRPRGDKGHGRSDSTSEERCDAYCPILPSIRFGFVTYSNDNRRPGSIAAYMCRHGYSLSGNPFRKCLNSGDWSGSPPRCRQFCQDDDDKSDSSDSSDSSSSKSGCKKLKSPDNGVVRTNGTTVGSYAKYVCDLDHYRVGDMFRKCLETGWTGEAPICKPILCDPLDPLEHGKISFTKGHKYGSVANYNCNFGYVVKEGSGDVRRECKVDGVWSGNPIICVEK